MSVRSVEFRRTCATGWVNLLNLRLILARSACLIRRPVIALHDSHLRFLASPARADCDADVAARAFDESCGTGSKRRSCENAAAKGSHAYPWSSLPRDQLAMACDLLRYWL